MARNPKQSLGPIGLFFEATDYAVTEGQTLEIAAMIVNLGAAADAFTLSVLGVPSQWLILPTPSVMLLEREASKQIVIKVKPPVASPSLAGKYVLRVRVASQSNPEQFKEIEISLNVVAGKVVEKDEGLPIKFYASKTELTVAPGTLVSIPITLVNESVRDGYFEFGETGIPLGWVTFPSPVVHLKPGEKLESDIEIQLPPASQIHAGKISFKLRVTNQANTNQHVETEISLLVAAFLSKGRVGVLMDSVQFSVAPGSSLTVPILLLNQGLDEDQFTLAVEGIPMSWVSTSSALTRLEPGEQKEITVSIRPPRASQSRAGRHTFSIYVGSKLNADQVVDVDCILTVASFNDYRAELLPQRLSSSDTARVAVKNLGNIQQNFNISWKSTQNVVEFYLIEPNETGQVVERPLLLDEQVTLRVPAGETNRLEFRARSRSPLIFGNETIYPFSVNIQTANKSPQIINGQLNAKALIPTWALLAFCGVCLFIFCALIAFILWPKSPVSSKNQQTQTVEAYATHLSMYVTQTSVYATQTSVYATQLAAAQQTVDAGGAETATALALTPSPTATLPPSETPTETLVPSETPTNTLEPTTDEIFTEEAPTEESTPTNTVLPPTQTLILPTATETLPLLPGTIAFASNRDGPWQIYEVSDPVLTNIKRVTFSSGADISPAWSPQGDRIAFTSSRDGNNEIYVMNIDGSNLINLTNNAANDQEPTWSLDGQRIAFTSDRDGNQEIYVMNINGSDLQNLTNNPANDREPSWGRDGDLLGRTELIVFTSDRDGNTEIYRMETNGQSPTNLTNNPASDYAPSASIKEEMIAFTSNRSGNDEIFVMVMNGSNTVNITNDSAVDQHPSWSPDGSWITYMTNREGNPEIYVIRPDGTERYNITRNSAEDGYPAWH